MRIQKYQQGGMAPAPAPAAQEGAPMDGGQDPLVQILQIAGEALQSGNCEAAMAVCEALLMLAQGGGEAAPVGEPQGEPVFKRGGKIAKTIKKEKGGNMKSDKMANLRKNGNTKGLPTKKTTGKK